MKPRTPGKWYIEDHANEKIPYSIIDEQGVTIAHVFKQPLDPEEWANGNACILATAPELFEEHEDWAKLLGHIIVEALQDNFESLKEFMTEAPIIFHNGIPRLESEAIKKAKGDEMTKTKTFTINEEIDQIITSLAQSEQRSWSNMCNKLIQEALDRRNAVENTNSTTKEGGKND